MHRVRGGCVSDRYGAVQSPDGLVHIVFSAALSVDSIITRCTHKSWTVGDPLHPRRVVWMDGAGAAPTCIPCIGRRDR